MLDIPLRVGISGTTRLGRGIAFQVKATPGMDLLWTTDGDAMDRLQTDPIDVFIEASGSVETGAETALAALQNQTHVVLTNPAVDLAVGPLLSAVAYENGLIVTSDAGTRHGTLATMIQEALIMGFDIVQAGCCAKEDHSRLQLSLAALANAFEFLPSAGGMTGPEVDDIHQALTAFDFENYGETPHIDFLTGTVPEGAVYLIVKPKATLPPEQADYLRDYHLGDGPFYLLHRPYHLQHLETPKAILGAAAGQVILSQATPVCDVYAYARRDLPAGTNVKNALDSVDLYGVVEPLNPDRVPISLLERETTLNTEVLAGQPLDLDNITLPDSPLTHLWAQQQELLAPEA